MQVRSLTGCRPLFVGLIATVLLATSHACRAAEPQEITFNRDVRPILSDKCFACHGPDANTREADLRLDLREGAIRDLGGHKAVDPGNIQASELIRRIATSDHDLVMPPTEFDKPISDREKEILKRWIASGAKYQDHWSFSPINRPNVPSRPDEPRANGQPQSAIDAFINRRINSAGLKAQ